MSLALAMAAVSGAGWAAPAAHLPGPAGLFGGKAAAPQGGVMVLSPGDIVVFTLAPGAGGLTPTVVAKGADAKARTLADGEVRIVYEGGGMTMLQVENHSGRKLHYKAKLMLTNGRSGYTSICPVMPHLMGVESWMDPIAKIEVGPFVEVGDGFNSCV